MKEKEPPIGSVEYRRMFMSEIMGGLDFEDFPQMTISRDPIKGGGKVITFGTGQTTSDLLQKSSNEEEQIGFLKYRTYPGDRVVSASLLINTIYSDKKP
jgi:hypothetical protein